MRTRVVTWGERLEINESKTVMVCGEDVVSGDVVGPKLQHLHSPSTCILGRCGDVLES
jgi:hypothetical protein